MAFRDGRVLLCVSRSMVYAYAFCFHFVHKELGRTMTRSDPEQPQHCSQI